MKALNLWEWLNLNEHEQNESCKHRTIMLTANLLLALVLALVYTQNSMLEISQSNIWCMNCYSLVLCTQAFLLFFESHFQFGEENKHLIITYTSSNRVKDLKNATVALSLMKSTGDQRNHFLTSHRLLIPYSQVWNIFDVNILECQFLKKRKQLIINHTSSIL